MLARRLNDVVGACSLFLRRHNDLQSVKYPGATVLLDLTANEEIFERVASLMGKYGLFKTVLYELGEAFGRGKVKILPANFDRYRDLLIGIVLNMTCNY